MGSKLEKFVSVPLDKEIVFESSKAIPGKTFKACDLDFAKINGGMVNFCERAVIKNGNAGSFVKSLSAEYCSNLAALISGIPYREIEKMDFDDFERVWRTVGAYVGGRCPKKFLDKYLEGEAKGDDDEEVFINPADKPGTQTKSEQTEG